MKKQYNIGASKENEIVIRDKNCPDIHAEINYNRGNWVLNNLVKEKVIYVNDEKIEGLKTLEKNDKIRIGRQVIYWSNYFYEGERQELYLKEFFTYNGRVSRSNFRALSLLAIGAVICVFFLPGLLGVLVKRVTINREVALRVIEDLIPIIYTIGFSSIGIVILLLAIKRIRDTGNPIWKLWIPMYNLKILFFDKSKR